MENKKENIVITLVEDNKEIRDGFDVLISGSKGFSCAATFADAESALKKIPSMNVDVVLMDINLPKMNGIECVKKLKPLLPNTQIIMLTMYEDSEHVFEALKAVLQVIYSREHRRIKYLKQLKKFSKAVHQCLCKLRMVVKSFNEKSVNSKLDQKLTEKRNGNLKPPVKRNALPRNC